MTKRADDTEVWTKMDWPSHEEIIEASGDGKCGYWDGEVMRGWGIPTKDTPAGWSKALWDKDQNFFERHGITVRRRLKPIPIEDDDLFTWR